MQRAPRHRYPTNPFFSDLSVPLFVPPRTSLRRRLPYSLVCSFSLLHFCYSVVHYRFLVVFRASRPLCSRIIGLVSDEGNLHILCSDFSLSRRDRKNERASERNENYRDRDCERRLVSVRSEETPSSWHTITVSAFVLSRYT